jgi:hypothetical protein
MKSLSKADLRKAAKLARNAFDDLMMMADLLLDTQEVDADFETSYQIESQIVRQLGQIMEINHTLHAVLIHDWPRELETTAAASRVAPSSSNRHHPQLQLHQRKD